MKRLRWLAIGALFLASSGLAINAGDRKFIREGMTESEVLLKIGKPDSESVDSGGGAQVVVKRWIYMPASGDSQTMTTITLRAGKVIEVSRQVAR